MKFKINFYSPSLIYLQLLKLFHRKLCSKIIRVKWSESMTSWSSTWTKCKTHRYLRISFRKSCMESYLSSTKMRIKMREKKSTNNSRKSWIIVRIELIVMKLSKNFWQSITKEQERCLLRMFFSTEKSISW